MEHSGMGRVVPEKTPLKGEVVLATSI